MTGDQVWQTLVTVGSVGLLLVSSTWGLARIIDNVKTGLKDLKSEMQTDVMAVRSDVNLLRTSIDGKLALAEAQTKAEIVALKAETERLSEEIATLRVPRSAPRRPRGAA